MNDKVAVSYIPGSHVAPIVWGVSMAVEHVAGGGVASGVQLAPQGGVVQ